MASVFLVGRRSLGKQNEQSMAKALAKILVKCEGNNSPKYDGKIWEEEIKYIVDVNGKSIDPHSQQEIKPGDRVIIRRPGKGGRRARSWHGTVMSESDVEEASRQAVKQPSSKRKRNTNSGMIPIQDPAKNRDVSITIIGLFQYLVFLDYTIV